MQNIEKNGAKVREAFHTYCILQNFDTWSLYRSIKSGIYFGIIVLCLSLAGHRTYANEINEFDEGSDGWSLYPSTMGRGSESGWINVTNDGEGSIRNNPTGTRYTYYWKLTRDLDLSNLESPSLELKYHFKGHNYEYFRVQVGFLRVNFVPQ